MKNSRFTESQIVSILKAADAGAKVKEICCRHGISDVTGTVRQLRRQPRSGRRTRRARLFFAWRAGNSRRCPEVH